MHQALQTCGFSWREARALTRLTTFEGSLPQGAPTSTTLANIVFSSTALKLAEFCAGKKVVFTNFVDDLTISAAKDFKNLTPQLLEILRQNRFFVNHNKIHYKRNYCEITGLFVRNGQLKLEKEMLLRANLPGVRGYVNAVARHNIACRKTK